MTKLDRLITFVSIIILAVVAYQLYLELYIPIKGGILSILANLGQ